MTHTGAHAPGRRKGKLPVAVTAGAALLLLAGLVMTAFLCLPGRISSIRVSGARFIPAGEVERMAGVAVGQVAGSREVRQAVERLKRHPGFAGASVWKGLDGSLSGSRAATRDPRFRPRG